MHVRVCLRRLALVVGLLVATAAAAPAQEMPEWAAPQEAERPQPPGSLESFECPNANPNCRDINPAPVDGGLALLALLGTGYAVRRLRRRSEGGAE
ncbi:MAG: hypothetical protein ABJF88_17150 [Rhodothermales bacterium]